jgi:hypothetical protein
MALRLNGSSSGYVELDVPAAAGSHTLTLPDGGGTSGNFLRTDGSGTLTWATPTDTVPWTDAGQTSFSGTNVVVTNSNFATASIIKIVFADMRTSTNSTDMTLQLGNGSLPTTGHYWSLEERSFHEGADNAGGFRIIGGNFGSTNYIFDGHITIMSTGTYVNAISNVTVRLAPPNVGHYGSQTCGVWTGGSTIDRFNLALPSGSFSQGHFSVYYG